MLALLGAPVVACTTQGDLGRTAAPLDCAWLAGDNCWQATASAASSCFPGASQVGTLSADGAVCSFGTGAVVAFDPPVTFSPTLSAVDSPFSFTLSSAQGEEPCMSFATSASGYELTTSAGTVHVEASLQRLLLSCPDGTTYEIDNPLSANPCDAAFLNLLPTGIRAQTGTSLSFSLAAVSSAGPTPVFTCAR